MDAVDEGIGRQYVERTASRFDDSRVIARAHGDPRRHSEARCNPGNQRALAEGGDRGMSQKNKSPALPCGEVE